MSVSNGNSRSTEEVTDDIQHSRTQIWDSFSTYIGDVSTLTSQEKESLTVLGIIRTFRTVAGLDLRESDAPNLLLAIKQTNQAVLDEILDLLTPEEERREDAVRKLEQICNAWIRSQP